MFNKFTNANAGLDLAHISSLADEMRSFPFGDVAIFHGKGESDNSLLIATHTDKPSFICTEICSDGSVKASLIGSLSAKSAAYSYAVSDSGKLAVVTASGSDDAPVFKLDLGSADKEESEKTVSVGDVFHAENTVRRLSESAASGAGISTTAQVLSLVHLCELLAADAPKLTVYVAFLKEGIFGFGSYAPVTRALEPKCAVCVGAMDTESAPALKPGIGAAVRLSDKSFGSDKPLSDSLINAGGVPAVLTSGSCAASKVQSVGVPSSQLDIPVKNLGTNTEIIDLGDVYRCAEILHRICK